MNGIYFYLCGDFIPLLIGVFILKNLDLRIRRNLISYFDFLFLDFIGDPFRRLDFSVYETVPLKNFFFFAALRARRLFWRIMFGM